MCLHFEWCHLWRDILNWAQGDDWMSVSKSIPTPRNVYPCMLFSSYLPDMPNMCMSQAVWRLLSPKIVLALDQCFYSQLFLILSAAAAEYARMILNLVVRLCSRIMSYSIWFFDGFTSVLNLFEESCTPLSAAKGLRIPWKQEHAWNDLECL